MPFVMNSKQSPTFSFEFVPIPRPYPSTATYAHPCYSKCVHVFKDCVLLAYTKSWLDRTNKRSFTVVGFSPERFLISVAEHVEVWGFLF
jgi:hypothetical protein